MARPHNRDIVIPQQRDGSPAVYPLGPPSAPVRGQPASVPTTDAVFQRINRSRVGHFDT